MTTPVIWNLLDCSPSSSVWTLTDGGITATENESGDARIRAAAGKSSGKWYYEILIGKQFSDTFVGLSSTTMSINETTTTWAPPLSFWFRSNGTAANTLPTGMDYEADDIICIAANIDTGYFWVRKNNGPWIGQGGQFGDPVTGVYPTNAPTPMEPGVPWVPLAAADNNETNHSFTLYSTYEDITYMIPDGYLPLAEEASPAISADFTATPVSGTSPPPPPPPPPPPLPPPVQSPVVVSRIQNRRGTQAQFNALYPPGYNGVGGVDINLYPNVLMPGELALCTDSRRVFIGNINGEYIELSVRPPVISGGTVG